MTALVGILTPLSLKKGRIPSSSGCLEAEGPPQLRPDPHGGTQMSSHYHSPVVKAAANFPVQAYDIYLKAWLCICSQTCFTPFLNFLGVSWRDSFLPPWEASKERKSIFPLNELSHCLPTIPGSGLKGGKGL